MLGAPANDDRTRMTEQEALAAPTIETPGDDAARLPFAKRIAPVGSISRDGQFEREATNQTAFFRDCLLDGRQSENANATPALGLSGVTVDTPIYFSLNDLLANPKYREFPILLVCEEAHEYLPRASESQFAGSRKSIERIAKEGRKYGVGLAVVSQRPHEVSETVLAQCGTFICLRITNPDDQGYVRSLVPESEGDLVNLLVGLGRGEALVLGEAVPLPTRLQFEKPNPFPNSDDVDFYDKWRTGPDDLDVDASVKRWRSQER